MAEQFGVKGLPELKAYFARVAGDMGKKPIRRMVSAGGQIVKAAVRLRAPIREEHAGRRGSKPSRAPGTLKNSIIMKFARELSNDVQAVMLVVVRQGRAGAKKKLAASKDAFYGKFVERGHRIVPRGQKIGRRHGRSLYRTTKKQRRLGSNASVGPREFMGPAFAQSKDKAAEAMVSVGTEEVKKVLGQ